MEFVRGLVIINLQRDSDRNKPALRLRGPQTIRNIRFKGCGPSQKTK
jgi:hypothetical protein